MDMLSFFRIREAAPARGVKFLELNRSNIEGDDFKDIMPGIYYCESRGWARIPTKRICLWRELDGGYLVAWSVTHTNRFNAAVMDFGIANLLSCHGMEWNTQLGSVWL